MPGNNEDLNIILNLIDNAAEQLRNSMQGIKKETDEVQKSSQKSSKTLSEGFKEAGKQLKDFRRTMFAVAIETGFIIGATKEWAKHNQETKEAYDVLQVSIKEITALIGSVFAPTIIALADLMKQSLGYIKQAFDEINKLWTGLFEKMSYAIQYTISFIAAFSQGVGIAKAHKIAMFEAGEAVKEMSKKFSAAFVENKLQTDEAKIKLEEYASKLNDIGLLFKAGQISAQEYFNMLQSAQNQTIMGNQIISEQLIQWFALHTEVTSRALIQAETAIQSQIDFFTTYKDLYMQGHADMFAFGNMLVTQFHANFSSALSSIILGEKKAKEAFAEFGAAMLKAIVDYMIQQAVAFALSQAMKGVITATTSAMASALASAWAPAAALASLATAGGNAAPAISGMALTTATAYALAAPKGQALGGEGVVDRPTLFLAGEAGPERYSFVPMNYGQKTRGDVYITISVNNPVVSSANDIDKLTEDISSRLVKEVERL